MIVKWFNTLFPKPPKQEGGCSHTVVEVLTCHPVTHKPIMGKCRNCEKIVSARTVWE